MLSCNVPTVENLGGTILKIQTDSQNIKTTEVTLKDRFSSFLDDPENMTSSIDGNIILLEFPGLFDTTMIRSMVEWDRSFRLCRGLDPSVQIKVRKHLSELLNISEKVKPYKPTSMVGLVSDNNQKKVIDKISSEEFKQQFPEVRDYYWGVKKMEGMSALFMESSSSAFITEDMFSQLEGFASEDETEGIFSLQLKEEYGERIGQLTGNDSIYLLHVFHREVYISKIIEPHITRVNFGMSGAFTVAEAKALGALWASEDIDQEVKIIALDTVKAE